MTIKLDADGRVDVRALSPSARRAAETVLAAGGEVSVEACVLLERVERGELDTDEAVRLIIARHGGQ